MGALKDRRRVKDRKIARQEIPRATALTLKTLRKVGRRATGEAERGFTMRVEAMRPKETIVGRLRRYERDRSEAHFFSSSRNN
jgi:hypothetical protein